MFAPLFAPRLVEISILDSHLDSHSSLLRKVDDGNGVGKICKQKECLEQIKKNTWYYWLRNL